MENHIKAWSFPTWAERLTAFQRPERGCVFLLFFTPKTRTETDSPRGSSFTENTEAYVWQLV